MVGQYALGVGKILCIYKNQKPILLQNYVLEFKIIEIYLKFNKIIFLYIKTFHTNLKHEFGRDRRLSCML